MDKINKNMDTNKQKDQTIKTIVPEKKPDEQSGIYLESRIKIFDPETQEVYLDGRA